MASVMAIPTLPDAGVTMAIPAASVDEGATLALPPVLNEGASLAIPVWYFVTPTHPTQATRGVATASTTGTAASHDVAQAPSASVHAPSDLFF